MKAALPDYGRLSGAFAKCMSRVLRGRVVEADVDDHGINPESVRMSSTRWRSPRCAPASMPDSRSAERLLKRRQPPDRSVNHPALKAGRDQLWSTGPLQSRRRPSTCGRPIWIMFRVGDDVGREGPASWLRMRGRDDTRTSLFKARETADRRGVGDRLGRTMMTRIRTRIANPGCGGLVQADDDDDCA